jgi:putative glutamine amidotransferase
MSASDDKPLIGMATDVEEGKGPRRGDGTPFVFVKQPYIDRVIEAGGAPVLLPPTEDDAVLDRLLETIDALIVVGSGIDIPAEIYGHGRHPKIGRLVPEKSAHEIRLVNKARALDLPLLGICNGMQVMNVAYGGTLFQDLPSECGTEHAVENATEPCHDVLLEAGTKVHLLLGSQKAFVNSSHHQAVREVGKGLTIAARAADGTIEAIEDPSRTFAVGVQWHPELIPEHAGSRSLFAELVRVARQRVKRSGRKTG